MQTEHHRNNHMVMENSTYAPSQLHHSTATLVVSEIDGDVFVGQAVQFLAAGFETSGSTMSFALYELALHPEIQNRLRADIMEVLNKYNGQVTYDGIQEMAYLDMVVSGGWTEAGYIIIRTYDPKLCLTICYIFSRNVSEL
jgi:cytochrome P450 family 6